MKIQDERSISVSKDIQSKAYNYMVYMLLASIVIQQFLFNAELKTFIIEISILLISTIYLTFKKISDGIELDEVVNSDVSFLNKIKSAVVFIIIFSVITGIYDMFKVGLIFVSYVLISYFGHIIYKTIVEKKKNNIDAMLDAQE